MQWDGPKRQDIVRLPEGDAHPSSGYVGPTSAALQTNVIANLKSLRDAHKLPADAPVPADLVFTSASGLDPHISPDGARFQVRRVAEARGVSEDAVKGLVESLVEGPQWGIFGQARVNVLNLNLALDRQFPPKK